MTLTGPLLLRDPGATIVTAPYGLRGPIIVGTSASTITIGPGPIVFDLNEFDLGFAPGIRLRATAVSDTTKWVEGICTSYEGDDDLLAITVDLLNGNGQTFNSWLIKVAGDQGELGPQGNPGTPGIADAPLDSSKYLRSNGAWVSFTGDLAGLQPVDADLTSVAALSGTNTLYWRSADGIWSPVSLGSGIGFAGGALSALSGGGNVSNSGTPIIGRVATWTGTTNVQGALDIGHAHGRFDFVSATACKFAPFRGNQIKISGTFYSIPAAGIAGLGNTGVFVNGVAGQNLAANTTYWVYAFNNAGTITGDFRTASHEVSSATGNIGTEILIADNSRSLIGMVRTTSASQFQYTSSNRLVASWFNRQAVPFFNATAFTGSNGTSSFAEISPTSARINLVTWDDEAIMLYTQGTCVNNTAQATSNAQISNDSSGVWLLAHGVGCQHYAANATANMNGAGAAQLSEGYHYLTLIGWPNSGTGTTTFNICIGGVMRG